MSVLSKSKWLGYVLAVVGLTSHVAEAAYTRAFSAPVQIDQVYQNEWGSPFVYFKSQINAACANSGGSIPGNGLYLYNLEMASPSPEFRRNKVAILLSAKLSGKSVILDYFYDTSITGWAACYIHGIQMVDP